MSQDVTQWLAEIKTLKQQLTQLQSDRDAAWESAETWRQLYNKEAEQRRTDTKLWQQAITSLRAEIQQLKGMPHVSVNEADAASAVAQEVEQLQSVEELKEKLTATLTERDRLLQALKSEQENHVNTRKSLTTALGDAIDRLTKDRTVKAEG